MGKVKNWFKNAWLWIKCHAPSKRRIIQLYAALLYNANIKGYITGDIFVGKTKYACVPGMNCYSCPGAVGACPLGALQNALSEAGKTTPYYMLGIIALFGVIFGRTICGFLCPGGLFQELLYTIKTKKVKKNLLTRSLTYLKYVILAVFVIAIPIAYGALGIADPGFCKYICPIGTFEGAFGLISNPANVDLYEMLGPLFSWKTLLLIIIIIASIFIYRPFCRFICPLGLIYGFFNRFSFVGVQVNKDKCTNCGLCVNQCKMDVRRVGDIECINCGECMKVCPEQAITWKGSKFFLHENQLEPLPAGNVKIDLVNNLPKINKENIQGGVAPSTKPEEVKSSKEPQKKKEKHPLYDKKKVMYFNIALFSVLTVALSSALIYYNFVDKGSNIEVKTDVPSFTLNTYNKNGEKFNYNNQEKHDKITVFNFWATWCGPCVKELPHFEKLQKEYSSKIEVVAIHQYIDDGAQEYVDETFKNYTLTFARDLEDDYLYKTFGGKRVLPMTVIVDYDSNIYSTTQGSMTYEKLKDKVDELYNLSNQESNKTIER